MADVNEVKSSLITTRRIVFTPAVELKDELKNTSVVITCYDRNGEEVKRVTSTDPGTVEDPENNTQGEGDDTTGDNIQGGDNQQGGGNSSITPGEGD